jgi:subtilase family serine protease
MIDNRFRLRALVVALALTAGTTASAATAVSPAVARPTRLVQGDVITGPLALSQPMHIVIGLRLRNKAELDALISTPDFKPLTSDRFVARYSPTQAQAQVVVDFLKQSGFSNIKVAPNRLLISGDAPASDVQNAFRVSLVSVKTHDGRLAYANTQNASVPASLQPIVDAVVGLQSVHVPHLLGANQVQPATNAVTGHGPADFPSIYGATGLPTAAGVDIGILSDGNLSKTITSLNTFTSQNGYPTVTTRQVGTPTGDTSGTVEWELDSQTIVGAGGGEVGSLVFYLMPNISSDTGIVEGINLAVTDNTAQIINGSLGVSEVDAENDGSFAATDTLLEQAVAQGQTFSFSTGDDGASSCFALHTDSACWPATSAYVVAVGGTTLDATTGPGATWNSETVWVDAGGAQSAVEPKPDWQTLWSGPNRAAPDVAFDADPNSGEIIINGRRSEQVGGTSLASPLFVGFWARVVAGKGNLGFAAPLLYPLPASDFHDVTQGSNGNQAGPGYDLASGRGSMIVGSVYNDLGGGGGNQPPVASFSYVTKGLFVQLTDTSTDSDGTIASRLWDSGDGRTATKSPVLYRYAKPGTYTVTLTVTDNDGATDTTSQSVTVKRGQ